VLKARGQERLPKNQEAVPDRHAGTAPLVSLFAP